ncbi:MAG: hypothetical protein NZL85_11305 [Fimbriimonadales bacterium]|nr:hypothetical protein [Fimbriimonadales bacterium]
MRQTNWQLWLISLLFGSLLSGCGGGGAGGGGGVVIQERVAYVRVIDAVTKAPLSGAAVLFLTDQGDLGFRRIVAGQANSEEVALNIARLFNPNARAGDFLLRNVPSNVRFRGIWVQIPAGHTAIVKYIDPTGKTRVIQLPRNPNISGGCLVASERAGVVSVVFGSPGLIDFGTIEVYPNNPNVPPPPIDENCP